MKLRLLLISIAALTIVPIRPYADSAEKSKSAVQEIESAARLFVNSLNAQQREAAIFSFDEDERRDWHYIPRFRSGLELKKMNTQQKQHAWALMRSALSEVGYDKVRGVLLLEQILRETEPWYSLLFFPRDPENFVFCFFGEPNAQKPWGWRMEGHHLSLNFTVVPGKGVAFTPAFFGASPARVWDHHARAGLRILEREHTLGFQLIQMLTPEQLAVARVDEEAPGNIFSGPGNERRFQNDRAGLAIRALNPQQRDVALALVREYLFNIGPEFAERQWERARAAGFENIRFVWAGSLTPDRPHYYRLAGPTMIIEYDNTHHGVNHAHSVWHDPENIFGEDLLKNHYEMSHNEQSHNHAHPHH